MRAFLSSGRRQRRPYSQAIVALVFTFAPLKLLAAQVTVLPVQKVVIEAAEFQTDITIDTGHETINTFSGTVTFPDDLVEVKEIRTGNSIINYWVEEPKIGAGQITFAGMTPGGYQGSHGQLFTIIFLATNQGQGTIGVSQPLFLKNDGHGTAASIAVGNSTISVLAPDVRRNVIVPPVKDITPPELFVPVVERSPVLANNAWLLFFSTQDKGTGVDHYEVKEYAGGLFSFLTPWRRANSPFILKDQSLNSTTQVRALDKAGNIRTVTVPPRWPTPWYLNILNWFILSGIILMAGLLIPPLRKLWRKR